MTVRIDVEIACDEGDAPDLNTMTAWATRAIAAAGRRSDSEMSIRVVDAVEMQALNRDFRCVDKPTNVLSFPAGEIQGLPADTGQPLGDVVVCAPVVRDESREQFKTLDDHWAHMIVHGTLHLLGFDHEADDQAIEMEGLETRILTENGVADPYRESRQET